jgi:hypothetical protein
MNFHERDREQQLAWAAGFLDGEGHFGVNYVHRNTRKTPYPTPIIQAVQSNDRMTPLFRLKDLFDGDVSRSPSRPRDWTWRLAGGKRLREALPQLLPFLCVKAMEAGALLGYALLVPEPGQAWRVPKEHREQQLELLRVLREYRNI